MTQELAWEEAAGLLDVEQFSDRGRGSTRTDDGGAQIIGQRLQLVRRLLSVVDPANFEKPGVVHHSHFAHSSSAPLNAAQEQGALL